MASFGRALETNQKADLIAWYVVLGTHCSHSNLCVQVQRMLVQPVNPFPVKTDRTRVRCFPCASLSYFKCDKSTRESSHLTPPSPSIPHSTPCMRCSLLFNVARFTCVDVLHGMAWCSQRYSLDLIKDTGLEEHEFTRCTLRSVPCRHSSFLILRSSFVQLSFEKGSGLF